MNPPPSMFKKDEVAVLLGAGASVDADIPHSATMVRRIENYVVEQREWKTFCDLYHYVRSAIFYSEGIRGRFGDNVSYNIERLVEALEELRRKDQHPLYPFIGAWNPRLMQVAGPEFQKVDEFREKIVHTLRSEWIEISDYRNAKYYEGILKFQKALNHPLRVFSLNYDLCVEKTCELFNGELPERGFDENRSWKWQLFEDAEERTQNIRLYKLHGSIDWHYDPERGALTYSDSTTRIKVSEAALIFGTAYKLQYLDPFLFLVYEFRRWTLEAKLLLLIGYGFGDDHVNGILRQAIRADASKKLVSVAPLEKRAEATPIEAEVAKKKQCDWIAGRLDLRPAERECIEVVDSGAKEFLQTGLTLAAMEAYFPAEASPFPDLAPR